MKTTCVMLVTLLGLCGAAWAADWPHWRGPGRDGTSGETGWYKEGAPVKVVWEGKVGAGYSGVAVRGGCLYTMGNSDGKDGVICLDAKTGVAIWRYDYPCAAGSYPGPRCTPAVDDASVYVISRNAEVFCLDSKVGTLRWRRDLKAEMKVDLPKWGLSGSPVLEGGLLLVSVGPCGMVLDAKTGVTKWDSGGANSGYASPVVAGEGDKRIVIVFGGEAVSGADLMTGRKLWEHPWVTSYHVNASDPVVVDGKVLITSGYGRGGALLDVSGAKPVVLWENKNMGSQLSTPVVLRGYAYAGHGNTGGGSVRCIEVKSGDLKWEFKGIGYGSLLLAGGTLLMLGDNGMLVVAEAAPEQCRELWKGKALDGTCRTMPVLSAGLIYCRNDAGRLVCLDLKGP